MLPLAPFSACCSCAHWAAHPLLAVTTSGVPVQGPFSSAPEHDRLVLHHYVVKSERDFQDKMGRGNVMNDAKNLTVLWERVEAVSVETCLDGVRAAQKLLGAQQPVSSERNGSPAGTHAGKQQQRPKKARPLLA